MNIIICDDSPKDRETLIELLQNYAQERNECLEITEYDSGFNLCEGECIMTQEERRCYLIQYLLKEEIRFRKQKIPKDKQGQENLLRSLMNTRLPKPIPADFLKIQDEYLIERNRERGITDIADLTPVASDPRLYIWP